MTARSRSRTSKEAGGSRGGGRAGRRPALARRALAPALASLLAFGTPSACADTLRISEVVTDPQQDHSENAGGNGVTYDGVPGSGTVSSVDEFVELFNGSTSTLDLTGFSLEMDDGTLAVLDFGDPGSAVLRTSTGSALDGLLPGGFLLIGNPPGALNNSVELRLLDAAGELVDLLEIEDGNATDLRDESIHRLWTGTVLLDDLARGAITPLALPAAVEPVPEPGSLALLGSTLLAGVLASARRARSGRRRAAAEGSARR